MQSKVEVVVAGVGGIFPKANDLDEFTKILLENVNTAELAKWIQNDSDGNTMYNNLPEKRHILFDATFFGLHRAQSFLLDPLTRLFLEKTFEAVVDAGVNPSELRGKTIPVLIGSTVSETESSIFEPVRSGFGVTGQARCMMSNRVSYWLNVNGPSVTMDANWNSGIQVIQQALYMIGSGMYDSAIVGATNCSIGPCIQWIMEERKIISKDGQTRPFDEEADGYSRSDGVVVLYLQRADLAKRNYATLLYANTIFNGSRPGDLIGCHLDSFQEFLKKCYDECGVNPKDVAYLETYGCGLKERDEKELSAVESIFCKNRSTPLQIGSVKTNIGHAEPVSALMSLIKIIVAMETGIIPAHLNYNNPNIKIPALTNGKIEVVTKNKPWSGEIAAINCIGIGSSYGHIIVRSNKQSKLDIHCDLPLLLTYSTRTEEGVQKIAENVQLQSPDFIASKLVHDVFSSNIPSHLYRGYTVKTAADKSSFKHFSGNKPPVWFVYSGMGSQWHTMGRDLMKLPIFAEAVYKCHDILQPKGVNLVKIITDDNPEIFENILNSFVGIASVQIGLTDVLSAIGIHPDGIIGHSVGELGCAYADKCLTAEQMILSAYYRGKASLNADLISGMMAAIGMGYSELKPLCPESIDIACHNSRDSCTISGPAEAVKKFVNTLKSKGVFARLVNVSNIPYHSRYIKPAGPQLLSYLKKIITEPKARSSKWISTSVSQSNWDSDLAKTVSPEYLTNNLLSSVQFEEGLPFIEDGVVAIEIAPHGLLQAILKRALPNDVVNVSLTKRDTNCLEFLFNSLGQLYLNGLDFNLNALYPTVPHPVPRGTPSLCSFIEWEHGEEWTIPSTEETFEFSERTFEVNLNTIEFEQFNHYQVDNKSFIPPVLYLGFINELFNNDGDVKNVTFEDVVFKNYVVVPTKGNASLTIMIQSGSGFFEVTHNEKIIATGKITKDNTEILPSIQIESTEELSKINKNNFYNELNIKGYNYQEEYKLVTSIHVEENGFKGTARHVEDWKAFVNTMLQMHLFHQLESSQHILLPKYIQRINISFDDLSLNENKESVVWFSRKIGILESSGVQISGIKYEPLEMVASAIKMENTKFVKHFDENIQDVEYGLSLCTKMVTDNLGTKNLAITELKEKYSLKYLPYVENYLKQKNLDAKTLEINEIDYTVLNESSLTIISGKFLNIASRIMSNSSNFFLLCFPISQSICVSDKYTIIAQFFVNGTKFYLIKKTSVNPVKVINVKYNKLSYKNMQMNSNPWTAELKTLSRDEKSRIYLVSRTVPVEGIQEFVTQMQNLVYNGQLLRFMFILDPSAPECKPEGEFYARVFEQDLVVQVFKNGAWGSFVDICESSERVRSKTTSPLMRAIHSRGFADVCKVKYLGLHVRDFSRTDDETVPCNIGAIDFAGTSTSGERIMGFAQSDLDQCKLMTDPAFVWSVPQFWSLCDAATVPYAYTMAYYTLCTLGNISKGDVVLVHAGCSEIGQAALLVAHNYGCTVFTTVANDQQKVLIKKLLPQIADDNILNSQTTHYELAILSQTHGRGVDVILNCLPGDHLHASKRLLAAFGRFIQLGTMDMHQHVTIGMRVFLNNISFYGVTGQNLLQIHEEDKRHLQEMISRDMKKGIVKPISRRIFSENRIEDSLRYLRSNSVMGAVVMQVSNEKSVQIQEQESYLIYADEQDSWISLIKWLVTSRRGAEHIIITNVTNRKQDFINRFVFEVKQKYNVDLILSKQNASNPGNARKLANEISYFGSPKEIFIFAMKDEEHTELFANIDIAFSQKKLNGRMVCILGTNKEQSYFRDNGLAVCNIMWDKTYSLHDVVKNLDVILTKEDSANIFLKSEGVPVEEVKDDDEIIEDESWFLPNSLKTLKQLGENELSMGTFVQLTSFGPSELREVFPVFVVPGLEGPRGPGLRHLTAYLMHPVFCVHLPSVTIQDDIVAHLAEEMLQVHQSKVYKLIGVSWGGILAIEIAKHLENLGKKIELHLVDGAPRVIHNFTNNFNKTGVFNMALLKQVIKVDGKNMENILSSMDLHKFDYKDIVKSLTVLKNLIEYSNFYKALPNKVNGPTTVILPENSSVDDSVGLTEHCDQIRFKIMRGNHRTLLQDKTVIDFINDNLV